MKKIFLILILLTFVKLGYSQQAQVRIDTIKAGDTVKTLNYTNSKVISYSIQQLDTNLASPDSIVAFTQWGGSIKAPAGMKETVDSGSVVYLTFTYGVNYIALGTTGQIRSGWIFKPTNSFLIFQLWNKKYLSNRKLLLNTYFYNP